uniref:HTH myb-type domain-containing protein n=1 Tax=Bionectria ochroleuca TaxID=29856 RepID=A0A0B7JTR2_BIOOC
MPHGLEGFDFFLASETASKRPLMSFGDTDHDLDAKRLKREGEVATEAEVSFEDGMDLLVQNALSNINDLMGQLTDEPDMSAVVPTTEPDPATDPMDLDVSQIHDSLPPAPAVFLSEPEKFVRQANINALGILAMSVLLTLSQKPFEEVTRKLQDPTSDHSCSLRKLRTSLEATRSLYSPGPILFASEFELTSHDSQTIILLSNLAQIGLWILDGDASSMREAEMHMMPIFRDPLVILPKKLSDLWVAIKTQLAIEDLQTKDPARSFDEQLNFSLLEGFELKLKDGQADQDLSDSSQELLSSLKSRKDELLRLAQSELGLAAVRNSYPPENAVRTFSICASEQLVSATQLGHTFGLSIPAPTEEDVLQGLPGATDTGEIDMDDLDSFFEKTTSGLVQSALAGFTDEEPQPAPASVPTPTPAPAPVSEPAPVTTTAVAASTPATPTITTTKPEAPTPTPGNYITDYKELEALVAESTSNYVKTTLQGLSPAPYQPTVPTSTAESMAAQTSSLFSHLHQQHAQHSYYTSLSHVVPEPQPQHPVTGENLPPNQSFPSAILYDKARQAALSKTTAHTRREGLHSTRRPWSQEEEKALMAGLDMVKGPHWSQILTLFGPAGTISDILKDRTQVQLKDKARNLKLFFLKTNSEMPYYLQAVTGELKTRAPTQAARKEAEERARLNSEEDQAKLQGIMALAGGLQHPPQNRGAAGSVSAVGSGVVTPAQSAAQVAGQHAGVNNQQGANGYTATQTPARPGIQTTSHQAIHSVAQPSARPQSQLPPQVPRPQPQQAATQGIQAAMQQPVQQNQQTMGQYGQQPTHHHLQHQMHRQASTSRPATPQTPSHHRQSSGTPTPGPAAVSTHSSPVPAAQPQPQHTLKLPTPPQPQMSYAPVTQASPVEPIQHTESHPTDLSNDNAAEAALLQGLQAAVAEATS